MEDLPQFDRERNGSLFHKGMVDSYYNRKPDPHWYSGEIVNRVKMTRLTEEETAEYMAGYQYEEDHKKNTNNKE